MAWYVTTVRSPEHRLTPNVTRRRSSDDVTIDDDGGGVTASMMVAAPALDMPVQRAHRTRVHMACADTGKNEGARLGWIVWPAVETWWTRVNLEHGCVRATHLVVRRNRWELLCVQSASPAHLVMQNYKFLFKSRRKDAEEHVVARFNEVI